MRSPRTATKSSPRSPQLEKARVQQRKPNADKNKLKKKILKKKGKSRRRVGNHPKLNEAQAQVDGSGSFKSLVQVDYV